MTKELQTKLQNYIDRLEEAHPTNLFHYTTGRKYIRIVQAWGSQEAVFCFVDFDGNLYKADTWAKPAQGIRGHIDNPILSLGGFYRS